MKIKNETKLLIVLIVVVLGIGNFYGYRWLSQKQASLVLTEKQLQIEKKEAEIDLKQQDVWKQRRDWIAAHESPLGDENDTKAKVLATVVKGARDQELEIVDQKLTETQSGPAGPRINMQIKVKGPMKGICYWLADLQKPEDFYAVTDFTLQADQDLKSYVCTLELARYFK